MSQLTMMASPHALAGNPQGWHSLAQHLGAQLGAPLRLELSRDLDGFRLAMGGADLVYAAPDEALCLIDAQGFWPVARPAGRFDEVLVLASAEGPLPAIDAVHGAAIATVEPLLSTRLALRMLRGRGVTPARLAHRDSWLSVVRSVWNGELPFGIIHSDAYEALSPQARAMVQVLARSDLRAAFPMLCARPGLGADLPGLAACLAAMGDSAAGAGLLADLGVAGWSPVSAAEIARLRDVAAG